MKLYNITKDKIENRKTINTTDGTMYPSKLSDEQLNSYGYYKVKYESAPNRRYYNTTPTSSIIGTEYVVGYITIEKPIGDVQDDMLKDLKESFTTIAKRPQVDTGLGYIIDGGRDDLTNFEVGRKHNFPFIKDINDVDHPATTEDYDTIINAIEAKGMELFGIKWAKKAAIQSFTTIADCIIYEAEPYNYTITQEDVGNDIEGDLVVGDIVVRYKNNVKEW